MYEAAARFETDFQSAPAVLPVKGSEGSEPALFAVELLKASLEALQTNREAATDYISRACLVLLEGHKPAGSNANAGASARGGLVPWQIKRVKAFVDANLEKQLSVREIAATVRLGPSHFQRAFRKSFGVSPHAYLVGCRVKRAQEIMLTSDSALSQIALAVGFSDQAHLTTRFHREVGVPPGVWRRENKEGPDSDDREITVSHANGRGERLAA